jgi:hypothetical protein
MPRRILSRAASTAAFPLSSNQSQLYAVTHGKMAQFEALRPTRDAPAGLAGVRQERRGQHHDALRRAPVN